MSTEAVPSHALASSHAHVPSQASAPSYTPVQSQAHVEVSPPTPIPLTLAPSRVPALPGFCTLPGSARLTPIPDSYLAIPSHSHAPFQIPVPSSRLHPSMLLSSCHLPNPDSFNIPGSCILPGTCTLPGSCPSHSHIFYQAPARSQTPPWFLSCGLLMLLRGSC